MRGIDWDVESTPCHVVSQAGIGEGWRAVIWSNVQDHTVSLYDGRERRFRFTLNALTMNIDGARHHALEALQKLIERRQAADAEALEHLKEARVFRGR